MRFTSFSEYRENYIYIVLFRLSSARRHVFWIPHFVDAAANDFHLRSGSPRSLLARLTECRWENWTLKAHRESNPKTQTSAAAKTN
jgi:hypothetical protein